MFTVAIGFVSIFYFYDFYYLCVFYVLNSEKISSQWHLKIRENALLRINDTFYGRAPKASKEIRQKLNRSISIFDGAKIYREDDKI